MLKYTVLIAFTIVLNACKSTVIANESVGLGTDFTIAFGSCNKHTLENHLWDDIIKVKPDLWIWGGDNIYADTDDIDVISSMYNAQKNVAGYSKLRAEIPVIGTWDDHDYGINDGGEEWSAKDASQQALLDFLDVPDTSAVRTQKGVYTSHSYKMRNGQVKIMVLDTRYFRSPLTPDPTGKKRFIPNTFGDGTILGEVQWQWLAEELRNSTANFNILISSIQFLSDKHGFETWGNFPHEVSRLKELIVDSGAKNVMILSGDRHISECSKAKIEGLAYPLIDFTSSGLTHAYKDYSGEPNPYRMGQVISTESFGLVKLNLSSNSASFLIVGDQSQTLAEFEQQY
ncbi:MAG: alkaline phosphatase D family protein [Flavobacteriaceae bacterium]